MSGSNNQRIIPNKRVVIRAGSNAPEQDRHTLQMSRANKNYLAADTRNSSQQDLNGVNLLFLEDYDQELDPLFIGKELKPYLNGVF